MTATDQPAIDANDHPLALIVTPGVGPTIGKRLLEAFGSVRAVCGASASELRRIPGVGEAKARTIADGLKNAPGRAEAELSRLASTDVRVLSLYDDEYPSILAQTPHAPLVLFVKGSCALNVMSSAVAMVGSRRATHYGIEQARRFASAIAHRGMTVVSGGARGIDTACHEAALEAGGSTIVVQGCGLGHVYPPENGALYDRIAESGRGAIISELPLDSPPEARHFPNRNRIISGLALGVLVIEAPRGSGALITARHALDDHGRDVMSLPGRVDSPSSEGANGLIKRGEAAMVTKPEDVFDLLDAPAFHLSEGTHADRYTGEPVEERPTPDLQLTDTQHALLARLDEPRSFDELCESGADDPSQIKADMTMLELKRLVVRRGGRFVRG